MMRLVKLIEALEDCTSGKVVTIKLPGDKNKYSPQDLYSYRGYYEHLCIEPVGDFMTVTNQSFIEKLKGAVDQVFTGYKGGEFEMHEYTEVWISDYGEASGIAILDVVENDKEILITTYYKE